MKKFLALVLTAIMVFAVLPVMSSAEDTVIPISECNSVIKSGKTYSISTTEEFLMFEEMNNNCDGATIILTNDITINDGVFSIDENQKPLYNGTFVFPETIDMIDEFYGIFDGQGHTIRGIYTNSNNETGLFKTLTFGAVVKNVAIENSLFIGKQNSGSICGYSNYDVTVQNCFSNAIVISTGNLGGIAGYFAGFMSCCYFNGTVIGYEKYGNVGGIVGVGDGDFSDCVNVGNVYGISNTIGGFAGTLYGSASNCSSTGNTYGDSKAAGFAGSIGGYCNQCFAAGKVFAENPSNFMSAYSGTVENFYWCCFVGEESATADYDGNFEKEYERYLNSIKPDPWGEPTIIDSVGVLPIDEAFLREQFVGCVVDKGNENNGYPIPKALQRRTVAPSITNVEYEKSSETRNTFNVTVEGRPAMIQFIEPTNGTRTYDRNHKNVTIKSYDADGNEVNSLDRTAVYEVWSIYSNMMTNVEIRTRAKYLSDVRYTWDSETYDFPMILANPIVSMELSSISGKKGPVSATVIADDKTEKVMFKMPDNTTVTVASKATDENGNKIFTGKAWMNKDGLNQIRVYIYRRNVWRLAGTLEYTVK